MEAYINELFNEFGVVITVLIISALPVIELRGAIPVGIGLGLSTIDSALLSFAGSLIPVPFILLGIRPVFNYLKKTKLFKGLVEKLTHKSLKKSDNIKKYGFWGLLIFVAIPLPGTGVWSGALIASLLDMKFKMAFPAILFGNLVAGLLITAISSGAFKLFG